MTGNGEHSNVVPILTEVVQELTPTGGDAAHGLINRQDLGPAHEAPSGAPALEVMDEDLVVDRVMEALGKQIDHMFEYRVREAVQPMIEALARQMVEGTRDELALTLRDIVKRAVHQEVLRMRRERD